MKMFFIFNLKNKLSFSGFVCGYVRQSLVFDKNTLCQLLPLIGTFKKYVISRLPQVGVENYSRLPEPLNSGNFIFMSSSQSSTILC